MGWEQFDAAGRRLTSTTATSRSFPELRLTTETGVPVSTSNRTSQGTVYATPSTPAGQPLNTAFLRTWTGTTVREQSMTGDKSLALSIKSGSVQDVFIKDSDLSLVAEYWKNSTITLTLTSPGVITWNAHGLSNGDSVVLQNTGGSLPTELSPGVQYWVANKASNTFEISADDGGPSINFSTFNTGTHSAYVVGVKAGNTTQPRTNALVSPTGTDLVCSGADNTYLWLGTVRATTSHDFTADSAGGTASQTGGTRYVWNAYNQVPRHLLVFDSADSWSYSTNAWRQANGGTGNKVQWVTGLAATQVNARVAAGISENSIPVAVVPAVAIGIDTTLTPLLSSSLFNDYYSAVSGVMLGQVTAFYLGLPGLGVHNAIWIEHGGDTATFYGDGGLGLIQSGLHAWLMC